MSEHGESDLHERARRNAYVNAAFRTCLTTKVDDLAAALNRRKKIEQDAYPVKTGRVFWCMVFELPKDIAGSFSEWKMGAYLPYCQVETSSYVWGVLCRDYEVIAKIDLVAVQIWLECSADLWSLVREFKKLGKEPSKRECEIIKKLRVKTDAKALGEVKAAALSIIDKVVTSLLADQKRKFYLGLKISLAAGGILGGVTLILTSAHPGGAATLGPGLAVAGLSSLALGLVLVRAYQTAQSVAFEIDKKMAVIEKLPQPKGKYLKTARESFQGASDNVAAFAAGTTSGLSEVIYPSINSIKELLEQHLECCNRITTAAHNMRVQLASLVEKDPRAKTEFDDALSGTRNPSKTRDIGAMIERLNALCRCAEVQFALHDRLEQRLEELRKNVSSVWGERLARASKIAGGVAQTAALSGPGLAALNPNDSGFAKDAATGVIGAAMGIKDAMEDEVLGFFAEGPSWEKLFLHPA
jgi:hypothetical protein